MEDDGRSWPLPSNYVTINDLRQRWLKRKQQQQQQQPVVEEQGTQRPQLPESRSGLRSAKLPDRTLWEPRAPPESSQRWWSCKEENVEENSSSGKKPGWYGESSGNREDAPLMVKAVGNDSMTGAVAVGEKGVEVEVGGRPEDIPQSQRRGSLNRRDDSRSESDSSCVENGVGDGVLSRKGGGSCSRGKRAVVENREVEVLQEVSPGQGASSKNGNGDRFRPRNKGKFVDNGLAVAAGEGEGPVEEGAPGGSVPLRKGARDESKSKEKNQVEVLSNEVDKIDGGTRNKSKYKKKNVVKKNQVEVIRVLAVEATKDEGTSGEGVPLRNRGRDESNKKKNVVKRNQVDVVEVLSIETTDEETSAKSKSMLVPLAGDDGMGLPDEAKKKSEQSRKGERRPHKGESMKYVMGRKENQVKSSPGIGDAVSLDLPLEIEGRFSQMFTKDGDRKMRRRGLVSKERDGYGKGYSWSVTEGERIWVKKGDGSSNRPLRAS